MDYTQILSSKYVGAEWVLDGNDYAGLTWLSDTPKPTKKALEALWAEVQYETVYARVEQARLAAYQSTTDPLFFETQRGSVTKEAWLAAVQNVKDANPYPTAPK